MPALRKRFIASVLVARRNLLSHCIFLLVKASLASICDSRCCSPQQTAMPALRKHSPCLCTHVLHFAKLVFFVESDCLAVNSNVEHVARCRHLLHCPRSTNLLFLCPKFCNACTSPQRVCWQFSRTSPVQRTFSPAHICTRNALAHRPSLIFICTAHAAPNLCILDENTKSSFLLHTTPAFLRKASAILCLYIVCTAHVHLVQLSLNVRSYRRALR